MVSYGLRRRHLRGDGGRRTGRPEFGIGWALLFMLLGSLATLVALAAVGALSAEFVQSAVTSLGWLTVGIAAVWWVLETLRGR